MATYYIDYTSGSAANTGLSPDSPLSRVEDCKPNAGDTVLIRRGNVIHGALHTVSGTPDAPITYGAYGDKADPKPVFCGTVDVSHEENWKNVGENVWKLTRALPSEPGNVIFDDGDSFGNMRWEREDLDEQGEWYDPDGGSTESRAGYPADGTIYLYSLENPARHYRKIEIALYGERALAKGTNIVLKDLVFRGSGVHGFASQPKNVTISHCEFLMIGGVVWNRELKIRFGNAVEFWEIAENVTVEHCLFREIYDSCVTHQGFQNIKPVSDVHFDDNIFINYGMAAYELRDLIPVRSSFCRNTCIGAGLGFAAQGEAPPRQSEIWPQPMGHHIFLWRVEKPSPDGSLEIKHNTFLNAPVGAAIYSIDAPEADAQVDLDENLYWTENSALLIRWNGKNYAPAGFAQYQRESGKDLQSKYVKLFR